MPLIPVVGRKRPGARFQMSAIAMLLWFGVLLHLFPVLWMLSASLKPTQEIFDQPFRLIPQHPSLNSYKLLTHGGQRRRLQSGHQRFPLSLCHLFSQQPAARRADGAAADPDHGDGGLCRLQTAQPARGARCCSIFSSAR